MVLGHALIALGSSGQRVDHGTAIQIRKLVMSLSELQFIMMKHQEVISPFNANGVEMDTRSTNSREKSNRRLIDIVVIMIGLSDNDHLYQ